MNLFEQILKESSEIYFRKDPNSKNALFRSELGEDVDVGASLTIDNNIYNFIWSRFNSNLNLENHGFTHYLTRLAYIDKKRVIDGQKIGKEIVNLHTNEGNEGFLCSIPIEIISNVKIDDCYDKEDNPLSILLLVIHKEEYNGRIKLITCYPTDNSNHIKWYSKYFYSYKSDRKIKSPDIDHIRKSLIGNKLNESDEFKQSAKIYNEVIKELIQEMEENLKKGYQIFTQKIATFKNK